MSDATQTPPATTTPPANPVLGEAPKPNGATATETPAKEPVLDAAAAAAAKKPDAPADDAAKKAADEAAKKGADDAAAKKAADEKATLDAKAKKEADDKAWSEFKPKLPEGITADEAAVKDFLPKAREWGLSTEQAQKAIEFDAQRAKAAQEGLKTERTGWLEATRKDEAFNSPEKLDAGVRVANKAFNKFASPELISFLKQTGLDAHPGLFKAFHSIGLAMKDDSVSGADGTAPGQLTGQAALDKMYPSMKRS